MSTVYRGKEIKVIAMNGSKMDFKFLNQNPGEQFTVDVTDTDDAWKDDPSDVTYAAGETGTQYLSEDWLDANNVAYSGDDPKHPIDLNLREHPTDFSGLRARARAAVRRRLDDLSER